MRFYYFDPVFEASVVVVIDKKRSIYYTKNGAQTYVRRKIKQKMRRSIIAKIAGILIFILSTLVVFFVVNKTNSQIYATSVNSLTPWEDNLLDSVNEIRSRYGLEALEWSYGFEGMTPAVTSNHDGSIYSDDELFTKYLVTYWFNKDNSIFLQTKTKYLYVSIEFEGEGDVLVASLYFPEQNEEAPENAQIPYYSEGNTIHYGMEEVIESKRPTVQAPDETAANPVFDSSTIEVPFYALDNIYDYSKYVKVSDTGKIILVHTDYYSEDTASEPLRYVTAVNNSGFVTSEKMAVSVKEVPYYNANTSDIRPCCMTTNQDGSVMQYGHIILACDEAESGPAKYVFEIISPDGTKTKIIRNSNGMIWNPTNFGIYSVSIYTVIDKNGIKNLSDFQTFTVEVAEYVSGVPEIKLPALRFKEGSLFIKDDELFTISGVTPGTTVNQLTEAIIIENVNDNIVLVIPDKSGENNVGTGTVVRIESANGEKVYCSYTILCYGDINGDGLIGIADFSKMRAYILSKTTLEGPFATCADINFDGKIGIADFSKLRAALLNKTVIEQNRKAELSGE